MIANIIQTHVKNSKWDIHYITNMTTLLLSTCLIFDMISGFFLIYSALSVKVSLIIKIFTLGLMSYIIAKKSLQAISLLGLVVLIFSVGPLLNFLTYGHLSYFIFDTSVMLKVVYPVFTLCYILIANDFISQKIYTTADKILTTSFYIIIFNLILGLIGLGKTTYTNGAGTTGLIYAGNELSATFLILCGYIMTKQWLNNKKSYIVYATICVIFAMSIATKTSILATLLLAMLIPLFVDNKNKKFTVAFLSLSFIVTVIFIANLKTILMQLGIYERMMWAYEQSGIWGLLLSGRHTMVIDRLYYYFTNGDVLQQLIGYGKSFQTLHPTHALVAEIDIIDILIQLGIIPVIAMIFFHLYITTKAAVNYFTGNNKLATGTLLNVFMILCLSQITGHIWTSGTIGIVLGTLYSLVFVKNKTI